MARKIGIILRNKDYTLLSMLVVAIFLFVSISISNKVYKSTEEKAEATALSVATNNIGIVKGVFAKYLYDLKIVRSFSSLSGVINSNRIEMLTNLVATDSAILSAWTYRGGEYIYSKGVTFEKYRDELIDSSLHIDSIKIAGPFVSSGGKVLISLCVKEDGDSSHLNYTGIDIDLMKLHAIIAENKDLTTAYISIFSNNMRYIYHPDEKRIGQYAVGRELSEGGGVREFGVVANAGKVHSDYLGLEVYKYVDIINLGGHSELSFFAYVPNLGFAEFIDALALELLLLALLALVCFVLIFIVGVKRWRGEFVSRQEVEQKNLKLQLENEQQRNDVITSELENLKSGLNPHFLFNSLSSLIILVKRDTTLAAEFARSLSRLYRYLLDYQNRSVVALEEELRFAEDYVFLQQIRFKNKLFVDFSLPVDFLERNVPTISLQTLIENAVKHNEISKLNPLHIKVYVDNEYLVVENNIIELSSKEDSTGIGQANLSARYSYLSDKSCQFYSENDNYFARIPLI